MPSLPESILRCISFGSECACRKEGTEICNTITFDTEVEGRYGITRFSVWEEAFFRTLTFFNL